jgi:hypothetical protein
MISLHWSITVLHHLMIIVFVLKISQSGYILTRGKYFLGLRHDRFWNSLELILEFHKNLYKIPLEFLELLWNSNNSIGITARWEISVISPSHFDFFLLIGWNFQNKKQWSLILEYKAKTTYTTLSIRFKIHMKIHWNSTLLTMWYTLFLLCTPELIRA